MNLNYKWLTLLNSLVLVASINLFSIVCNATQVTDSIKYLHVQDGGRIKPFDTFARESLSLIYGKSNYNNAAAVDVVFTWMLAPEHWNGIPIIQVRHNGLREALKLDGEQIYYSSKEILSNERLQLIFQQLATQRKAEDRLDAYSQAVQQLENQLSLFEAIKMGMAFRILPKSEGHTWQALARLDKEGAALFVSLKENYVATISAKSEKAKPADLAKAQNKLESSVSAFVAYGKGKYSEKYGDILKVRAEVHHNSFSPFQKAWIFYLIAAIFLACSTVSSRKIFYKLGWIGSITGMGFHIYGFALRVFIINRAPVTNMYETIIWVAIGAIIFAMIMEYIYRYKVILLGATLVATFCLILSDLAPAVLDSTLTPLEPVLRDNFWLLTHVLMITLSYAAFFLAFILGNLVLVYYLRNAKDSDQRVKQGSLAIYRSIQIGVVLLTGGIILGGIWADYSWGRFWGWDPKETWALIALLGYLAILHGRMSGMLRSFGVAAAAVIGFTLVIMAWYGVNFVLGAGLHSYGFGAGGVEYVSAFVGFHILFVVYSVTVRHSALKRESKKAN